MKLGLSLIIAVVAFAQHALAGRITTGTITALGAQTGTIIVQSEQTRSPITYTGLNKTIIRFASGRTASFADVALGQLVTAEYAMIGEELVVAALWIPDPKPAAIAPTLEALTGGEIKALNSKSARDGDITTTPAGAARIDGDITTEPGKKDPADPDITKQPD